MRYRGEEIDARDAARELVLDPVVSSEDDLPKIGPAIVRLARENEWTYSDVAAVAAAVEEMTPEWLALLEELS